MATIKTAVSLQESLFERAEDLAQQMRVSHSRLFTMALEDFISRQNKENLTEQINRALDEAGDEDPGPSMEVMRRHMRRMISEEDKW